MTAKCWNTVQLQLSNEAIKQTNEERMQSRHTDRYLQKNLVNVLI